MTHKRTTAQVFQHARALRRSLTLAERRLWSRSRNHQLQGLGFQRQHAVGPFVLDFVCLEKKLVVEVDGDRHASQPEYDAQWTAWLGAHGYRVQRFSNREVKQDIDPVLESIWSACNPSPPPSAPFADGGGREGVERLTPPRPSPAGTSPPGRELAHRPPSKPGPEGGDAV